MHITSSGTSPVKRIATLGFGVVAMVASLVLVTANPAHADTFTVNTIADNDDGTCAAQFCSLREAINAANANAGPDTIDFDLNAGEVGTISPASALPTITDKVTVDGYTQPGASENTATTNANNAILTVQLSGANAPPSASGLAVSGAGAAGTKIRGLVINRFGGDGVFINAQNTVIEGNFIGTNAAGDADLGNRGDGVILLSSGNLVGGPANAAQNVISGNGDNGVKISDTGATGNTISNNHVGTDADAGEDLGNSDSGVFVADAPGNTVGGSSADGTLNIISGNDEHGVRVFGVDASGNRVLGNLIGLNLNGDGLSDIGNILTGVHVSSTPQVQIGGTGAGQGNTISDNGDNGVGISGSSATNTLVLGNRIGTDKNGNSDHGNGDGGVRITGASNNRIGGTSAASRNVVSGNDDNGVFVSSGTSSATNNRIEGNFIGTNASGANDVGNAESGVRVETSGNFVGGTATGARNVISGNTDFGVFISRNDASGNLVQGNFIGTNAGGTANLGNADGGVFVVGPDNTVGGTAIEAGNRIAFNGADGVSVLGDSATANRILRNSIFSNGGLGIDLSGGTEDAQGATANDPQDPDTGPNDLQNKPVLDSFSGLTIEGRLNSTPNMTFTIRFFANPQGEDEGRSFLGQKSVTTNSNGKVNFDFTAAAAPIGTQNVTATATRAGNTSEFSAPRAAS